MATSPLFGWEEPDDTDLVKDGAAAIRTLANAIDTSMGDLLGGTSGQVLKKNSNANMDFVWSSDATGMTNPMTTTGDVIYSSSGSTPARLGIGSTGNVLTVSGGVPTWAAPAGGGKLLQLVYAQTANQVTTTSAGEVDTDLSATITPTSSTSKILVIVNQQVGKGKVTSGTSQALIGLKLLRGASVISNFGNHFADTENQEAILGFTVGNTYLDEPATTSATTYKTTFSKQTGSNVTIYVQPSRGNATTTSSITLMEIGA